MDRENIKLGFAGKLAKFFVINTRLSILLIISLFVWGILSFLITPKQYNPEIVAPAFQIITEFPAATNTEVEELITKPLENVVMDIEGVDEVLSQSIDGGLSIVTVKFFVGESIEDSKIKLSQKVGENIDLKPQGVNEPIIKEINPEDVPILTIAISSDKFSLSSLKKLAIDIRENIKKTKNTTNITIHGGREKQAKVMLDPNKLISQNISILQILDAIQKSNTTVKSGKLDLEKKDVDVELNAFIKDIEDLENIVVISTNNDLVYLSDVAQISYEEEAIEDYVRLRHPSKNTGNTVYISVAKKKGSNISNVTSEVLDELEKLKTNLIPASVDLEIVRDEGKTASEEIMGLVINLIQAIVIVFFVLLIFLGSRASFVVAVAIPLTLATVFGVGLLAGQTINRITLFALILSLGLLVDNATVVVENAVRHINTSKKTGKSNKMAVIEAVDEVGVGLFMSTVTTLFAFFPMAFVTGMMGPYMGPIPFFVPAALTISMIIAFTINPFLASQFIKAESEENSEQGFFKKNKYIKAIEKKVEGLLESYKQLLYKLFKDKKLRKSLMGLIIGALIVAMMLPVFGIVKFRMLPKADREQFYVYLDFPIGTDVHENNRITDLVENKLLNQESVLSVQSFVGTAPIIDFNGLFKGAEGRSNAYQSTIKVNLTHHDIRKEKSEEIVQDIRPVLYKLLEKEPDIEIKLIEDPPGPPVLSTVLLKIQGNDYEKLKEMSYDIEDFLSETPEVVDIDNSRSEKTSQISLKVNHEKALSSGIKIEEAAYALRIAFTGTNATVLHNDQKEQEYIFLQFDQEHRNEIEDLASIYLSNSKGQKVPLSEIVDMETESKKDILYRDNREKTIYVYAEMGNRSVTYAAIDMFLKLIKYKLSDDTGKMTGISFFGVDYLDEETGEEYQINWGGEWELTVEVFRDLGTAMFVAIFLIYVVLVAQFHSFKTPLIIMGTIPLAMIGVLPGFAILGVTNGIYFNATSMIGVIALAGIVVNNAIILVEYLNGLIGTGIAVEDALVEAGSTRLRPIVLTSLTTILGSFTIIGDPVWAGLAWSIIFGISISTVLTLIIFPILYYTFQGKEWNSLMHN